MLFQKLNNPPKMFSKLNHQSSMFSKHINTQTIKHHIPNQSNENKYRNDLELSIRK